MTVFAVFAAIALAFVVYFSAPTCQLRGEETCEAVEETQPPEEARMTVTRGGAGGAVIGSYTLPATH